MQLDAFEVEVMLREGRHQVVAALFRRKARVLLCRRSTQRSWYPGVWDLPGGHVEPSERPNDALVREIREELGLKIRRPSLPPLGSLIGRDFELTVWVIDTWIGEPINRDPSEHDAIAWFNLQETRELPLADPAYLELIKRGLQTSTGHENARARRSRRQ